MSRPERWASRVLFIGGLLGVALMVVGVVATAFSAEHGLAQLVVDRAHADAIAGHADTIVSLHQLVTALSHHPPEPVGVATLGIFVLFVTPLTAVATAGVAFALDGDRRFVTIAAIIVAALIGSVWLGGA